MVGSVLQLGFSIVDLQNEQLVYELCMFLEKFLNTRSIRCFRFGND